MTDIVEELRQASLNQSDYRWEAADEIERLRKDLSLAVFADNEYWQVLEKENERLRAGNEDMRHTIHQWEPNMAALRAENGRLRAALERIAFGKYHWEADAQEEARAALEGSDG